GHDLAHGAMHALVGLGGEPGLEQADEVIEALEGAVALEEVLLHVADHAFHLARGAGPVGPAGFGAEGVMAGELPEARVEAHRAWYMLEHRRSLVVDPHLAHAAAEPLEGAYQALVGVLGVAAGRGEDMKAPRVAEHVHGDVDLRRHTADRHDDLTPVVLQLHAGPGLKAHRRPRGARLAPRAQILAQHRQPAGVTEILDLAKDHPGVAHPLG